METTFSPRHFLGIFLFLVVTGIYYSIYFTQNNISPLTLFGNLVNESTKRTVIGHGIQNFLLHIITFPFEFLYHFAPWTIFLIVLINKQVLVRIKENRFIHFSACFFAANIIIYWLSPEVYARYLFMFLPPLFSVLFYLYFKYCNNEWQKTFMDKFVVVFCALLTAVCFVAYFTPYLNKIDYAGWKVLLIGTLLLFATYIAVKHTRRRLYALVLALVIGRVGFNLFVIDQRGSRNALAEDVADRISVVTINQPLYLDKTASIGNFDGMSFHISKRRKEILRFNDRIIPGAFYITDEAHLKGKQFTSYIKFKNYLSDQLYLVQYK